MRLPERKTACWVLRHRSREDRTYNFPQKNRLTDHHRIGVTIHQPGRRDGRPGLAIVIDALTSPPLHFNSRVDDSV